MPGRGLPEPGSEAARLPRTKDRLAFRLAILIPAAFLPLGALGGAMIAGLVRPSEGPAERILIRLTEEAVSGRAAALARDLEALGALEAPALTRLKARDEEGSGCAPPPGAEAFDFLALLNAEGAALCGAAAALPPEDEALREAVAARRPIVASAPEGLVALRPVLEKRRLLGFLYAGLRDGPPAREPSGGPPFAALVNWRGDLLWTSAAEAAAGEAPDGRWAADLSSGASTLRAFSRSGEASIYALAEAVPGQIYALGRWPEAEASRRSSPNLQALALLALTWLGGLAAAFWMLERVLLRHLRGLGRRMRRFALGLGEPWTDLPSGAPIELRELNGGFRKMALVIARDEARLQEALAEKSGLLREIHHRVRNNLQIIASIINLQIRRVSDPQAVRLLRHLQSRVLGLATIHRHLHEGQAASVLRADLVLEEILRRLIPSEAERRDWGGGILLELRLEPVLLAADRMTPLSFLVTEAVIDLTERMERAATQEPPRLGVSLTRTRKDLQPASEAVFEMRVAPPVEALPSTEGLSTTRLREDLIRDFARQLGADLEAGRSEDERGAFQHLRLRLPLGEAEAPPETREA